MYKMFTYAVLICSLSACSTVPVVKQAQAQAEANKIISASLDDRLIAFYVAQNCMI